MSKHLLYTFLNEIKHEKRDILLNVTKTIWNLDIHNEKYIYGNAINKYISKETNEIVTNIYNEGHNIHFFSESDNSVRIHDFIDKSFNHICVKSLMVFKPNYDSLIHLHKICDKNNNFILFDKRNYLLDKINKSFKNSTIFWCPNPLEYDTFLNYKLNRINFPQTEYKSR